MQNIGLIMKKYGIKPKHNLGQNFLVNPAILEKIVETLLLQKEWFRPFAILIRVQCRD
ncbi:MAG: hypothetical protein V1902_00590 [Candidatus Falkowbacteria bacterium]